jgi:serine/threonine-protein kinase
MSQSSITDNSLPSPYKVIKKIGSGGFGNVYLVINTENNHQCVIKQLHLNSNQPDFIKHACRLFEQEADILKKLDHPQIPNLIDYFKQDGEFYLVEEYIKGHSLKQELKLNQPWAEADVINLLYQGLSILRDIHAQGIIHQDVKPDNFIRRQQDQKLVLIDFGAVKEFNLEQSHLIDHTVGLGTLGYMPIEQAWGKPRKNSDIYAMGMIAIQALTGKSIQALTAKNSIDLAENEETEVIWANQTQINPRFKDILTKMICADYKERYQSAQEVITALNHYQQQPDLHQYTSDPVDSPQLSINSQATQPIYSIPEASFTSSKTNDKIKESNSLSNWLKSPLGLTITAALSLGLVATGVVYYLKMGETDDCPPGAFCLCPGPLCPDN